MSDYISHVLYDALEELTGHLLSKDKRIKELEAENAGLRNRGAICFSVQELDNHLAFDVDTGQVEIYETEQDAIRNRRAGYVVKKVRVCLAGDEGEA